MTGPPTARVNRRARWLVLLVVPALVVSGCGPGRERGTLSGTVKFQGKPVTEGMVILSDPDHGDFKTYPIRPDGTFEAKAEDGKGIWAGQYRVAVAPKLAEPEMGASKGPPKIPIPSNIPPRYWKPETSGISVEVKEGENEPLAIELKP